MQIHHEVNQNEMLFHYSDWSEGEMSFHWHEKIEIVQCMSGSFEALIDGVNYSVKKGDIVVISERLIHRFTITEKQINVRLAQLSYKVILNHNPIPKHVKPHITAEEIASVEYLGEKIENLFELMQKTNPQEENNNIFSECIYAGLYFLLGDNFPTPHYTKTKKKEKHDFYETVKYVNEHYREDITVSNIAESLYTDRGRLSRLFLKYSGVSLNSYINTLRLNEAVKLIESGCKITDAALESGFQTVRTFSNVYKNYKRK